MIGLTAGWTEGDFMRIGLVGFSQGYYAVSYLRYLHQRKGIEIVAVCDLNASPDYVWSCAFVDAAAFANEMDAPLMHSLEEVIRCRPDAVLLCCETYCHTRLTAELLAAGIHVFVSKPLCFSSRQADALAAALPADAIVLCGQPLRYEIGIREAISRIRGGEIGQVYSVRIRLCHAAMIHQAWEREEAYSGGPLGTYGIYLFDLARELGGVPVEVLYALGKNAATPEIEAADTVSILGSGGGILFQLELLSAVNLQFPFIHVEAVGTKGVLETRYDNAATLVRSTEGLKAGDFRTSDMTKGEMEHFLACLRREAMPECDVACMRYVTRCIEAVKKSMASGGPERIDGG